MNNEFVNIYIERLLTEINELNKNRFMIESQLKVLELTNSDLQLRLKAAEAEIEKHAKKLNKSKEVNTF